MSSPVGKGPTTIPTPVRDAGERSQSVPMHFLQETPVPSEIINFGLDPESSNFLVIDESSESLLIDSGMNNDNLNAIFSIITEMESRSQSHPNTPTAYSQSVQITGAQPTASFFDDLDCDVTLSGLTGDVAQLGSDVL